MSEPARVATCLACGTELAPSFLACPRCQRLVHGDRLKALAAQAEEAETRSEWAAAVSHWEQALTLLPPASRQHEVISQKLEPLRQRLPAVVETTQPTGKERPSWTKRGGPLGFLLLLVWKLKVILLAVFAHAKLLLLGFSKLGTVLTMLASLGVYWAAWGWKFAVGIVLSLYVHEMGHVIALRRLGIPASAPMFIPGFGAVVRLKAAPPDARSDARSGLAGPLYGAFAAIAFGAAGGALGSPMLLAISQWGARVNLFNLIPIWQLDGSRGLHSLSRYERLTVAGALLAAALFSTERFLLVAALLAGIRAFSETTPEEGDRTGLLLFVGLTALLALIASLAGGALPPQLAR